MILLRNVLLAINGCFLLMAIPAFRGDLSIGKIEIGVVAIYLVLDFAYLALTYPTRKFSEYVSLLKNDSAPRLSN
jgi:hypothetical protein